jgi:hypothetical protein
MAEPIDLTCAPIATAIDNAAADGHPVTLAYVDEAGAPVQTVRGSTHVHDRDRLAIWVRQADGGLATAIRRNEVVSLLYYATEGGRPKLLLTIRGRARVAPEEADTVYAAISEGERGHDPQRQGVPVLIEADSVRGMRAEGPIEQERGGQG